MATAQTELDGADIELDDEPTLKDRYVLFTEMLVFAIISLIASVVLSYDAIVLAANPDAQLNCSINAVLDCATVGKSWQASVFGFPNAFLGMISEPVVMTIAVASLCKVKFPRWFMLTANGVYFLGLVFAYWLLYQSTFVIGALCPWCLTVTISTTFVFYSMTQWNVLEGRLFPTGKWHRRALGWVRGGWFTIALIAWLALVLAVEVVHWLPRYL